MARGKKITVKDKDLGWVDFFKRVGEMGLDRLRVGVLADSAAGGLHVEGADLTVAEIAAVNEFGTEDGHIPARSFLRSSFDANREANVRLFDKLLGAVLDGKMPIDQALGLLGLKMSSDVKKKIASDVPPPNAQRTIEQKGSARTLVDTGRMLNAVTWAVDKDKKG